jgi:ABC-2 type transport system permease protein
LEAAHPISNGSANSLEESLWFLAVLGSNALLGHLVVGWVGSALFRASYSRLQDVDSPPATAEPAWIDRAALALGAWLPEKMQHLLVKDLRIFRRDPVQWTQAAIFFGLLSLFFFNIKRFQYDFAWMNIIGYLNLSVVGLILATFTTRFIFPMVSLEGRRFWILGTLPIERDAVVWSKFLFAVVGSILPCSLLVLLSDIALQVIEHSPLVVVLHQVTCWALCVGLAAIAVGLGARLPDFKESSPSKIAAGFGGTLNLVLSSIYIIVLVSLTAVPVCAWVEVGRGNTTILQTSWGVWLGLGSIWAVVGGVVATLLLAAVATWLPLRVGLDAFRTMEF